MGAQRTRLGVEGEEARELGWVRWSVVGFSPEGEEAIENLSGRVTGSGFSLEMPLWVSESSLRLGGRWVGTELETGPVRSEAACTGRVAAGVVLC